MGTIGGDIGDGLTLPKATPVGKTSYFDLTRPKVPFRSKNFNFSMLNSYSRCPLEFYFKYVAKARITQQNPSIYEVVGNVLHETAAKVQETVKKPEFKKENKEQVKVFVQATKETIKENFIISIQKQKGIKDKKVVEELIKKPEIKATIEASVKKIENYAKKEVVAKEKALFTETSFSFPLGEYKFFGTWDRVNKNEETGEVEVIDYKSKNRPLFKHYSFQMYIYGLAYYLLHGVVPKLTLKSLSSDFSTTQYPNVAKLEATKEKIIGYIKEIQAGSYQEKPTQHKCSSCKFGFDCPKSMKTSQSTDSNILL